MNVKGLQSIASEIVATTVSLLSDNNKDDCTDLAIIEIWTAEQPHKQLKMRRKASSSSRLLHLSGRETFYLKGGQLKRPRGTVRYYFSQVHEAMWWKPFVSEGFNCTSDHNVGLTSGFSAFIPFKPLIILPLLPVTDGPGELQVP